MSNHAKDDAEKQENESDQTPDDRWSIVDMAQGGVPSGVAIYKLKKRRMDEDDFIISRVKDGDIGPEFEEMEVCEVQTKSPEYTEKLLENDEFEPAFYYCRWSGPDVGSTITFLSPHTLMDLYEDDELWIREIIGVNGEIPGDPNSVAIKLIKCGIDKDQITYYN